VIRRDVTGTAELSHAVPLLEAAADPRCERTRKIAIQQGSAPQVSTTKTIDQPAG